MGAPTGLAEEQLGALDRLRAIPALAGFYLAGGSAVVHHLGHRRSLDLDLFSQVMVDVDGLRRALVSALPDLRLLSQSDATLKGTLGASLLDVVSYPHPPLEGPQPGPRGFPVAGLRDLATMKLSAIARRGIRRDFWDLEAIVASGITLRAAARDYVARFGLAEADLYHVMRSLTYFDDAEKDPVLPAGLTSERWEGIKAFWRRYAPDLLLADGR